MFSDDSRSNILKRKSGPPGGKQLMDAISFIAVAAALG
jgi:hypothetical protein